VRDEDKPKSQLIGELAELRQRIAECEALESELRRSEANYRELADSLPQVVFETNERGDLIFANSCAFDLFGYTWEEFEGGLNAFQMIAPGDRERAREQFSKVLGGENLGGTEYTAKRKDKSTFPVEIYSSPILRDTSVIGLRGIIVDATEHKETEKALRESEEKYAALVENSKDGVIMIQDGVLVFINEASTELVGYLPEEMIGSSFVKFAAPAYREQVRRRYRDRMEGKDVPSIYEIELLRKDGTTVSVELNAIHIEFGGRPTDLAFVRDITERRLAEEALRESEERFRILVEESPFGVSIIGKDGRYKYLNPTFRAIFGYDLNDIPTGRQWFRKAFPDRQYRHEVISAWINDLTDAEPGESRPETFAVTCKDGSVKTIQFRPVTMKTGDQFVIYEDVTEKKKLEEQLHLAQRMEALGTLAGGIAHNFNNLLTGMMGNASLMLLNTEPDHPHYERLKAIEKLVNSGSKLTRQLLGYARKGRYEIKPLDINRLVKETADTFNATRRDIRVHQLLEENLHSVHADQGQIEQILWNLYVNAADAMADGGNLFIETRNSTHTEMRGKPYTVKPGTYALITVRDTGSGMDKKTMERIFEPFFTTKGFARGTGLGLASTYGMVKAHGGYIDVESSRNKGAAFSIYLPASRQAVADRPIKKGKLKGGKETLLLVDDEEGVLEVSQELLEMLGYTVITAKGGKEAIELYRNHVEDIDMVILDLIMPDMGGRETYDQLKGLNPQVKVLLSSGYSINGQAYDILKHGCDGFIQKPFEMGVLSQRIREILEPEE
jgi:PAS domain S-box-containing protein